MSDGRDVIFLYDGTFYGLLTVVFECFLRRVMPYNIEPEENVQQTVLCDYEYIETNIEKSARVEKSIHGKMSYKTLYAVFLSYLSNMPDKEITILHFIKAGFKFGKNINNHLTLDCVNNVINAARNVYGEAHLLQDLCVFQSSVAEYITRKSRRKITFSPVLEPHFTERYRSMPFIIHDTQRNLCLVYNGKSSVIRHTELLPKLEFDDDETKYRELWKCFFKTIEIKERHNEKCQQTHLPLRYRKNMTEFSSNAT